jgi:NADH-quinone oxidoreductase subunit M
MVLLTALLSFICIIASFGIEKAMKAYFALFLLLDAAMMGVFCALDFFLFFVFWEVMLLPMYFLIGIWGGPRKEYAAIKFFLYTLLGSVLMLIAILLIYFNSDLRAIAQVSDLYGGADAPVKWADLHVSSATTARLGRVLTPVGRERANAQVQLTRWPGGSPRPLEVKFAAAKSAEEPAALYDEPSQTVLVLLPPEHDTAADAVAAINANPLVSGLVAASLPTGNEDGGKIKAEDSVTLPAAADSGPVHTFNILALAAMGQHTNLFSRTLQIWAFWLLFIGFAIKVPSVPVHTWLPDAHVEAPTPISMILAGVLLKMGGYGIIRFCYPICPEGGYGWWGGLVCLIGVVSMIYGGFAAMAQKDFKRLVAYSSVSHMGYVVLGLGVWSATSQLGFNSDYWGMGVKGAMFQMIAHGISSAGMFFMVGVVYDRVHHRNLNEFGGLFGKMPAYTALSIGIFFAGLGLPGLCGFVGEVLVVLSVFEYSVVLAILSASVVIVTAAYILWAIQRVYLGAEYKGPHEEALSELKLREWLVALPLFVFAIIFGVLPYQTVLRYMDATVDRQVQQLADWTKRVPAVRERARDEATASNAAGRSAGRAQLANERNASEVLASDFGNLRDGAER